MGLELKKELATGVEVTYWNIASVSKHENFIFTESMIHPMFMDGVEVTLFGYVSQEKRKEGKDNVSVEIIRLGSIENVERSEIRSYVYKQIKTLPEWENSIDIL